MRIPHTIPKNLFEAYRCSSETTQLPCERERAIRAETADWHVPDLKTLAIQACTLSFPNHVASLTNQDREQLVELLPLDLTLEVVLPLVHEEFYWMRRANERWEVNDPGEHGDSWLRLFCERHVAEYIEALEPDRFQSLLDRCQADISLFAEHVRSIRLRSVRPTRKRRSQDEDPPTEKVEGEEQKGTEEKVDEDEDTVHHIPMATILSWLPKVSELTLRFGLVYMDDGFEWRDFRFSVKDCLSLGEGLRSSACLTEFRLTRSNLDQPRVAAILQGAIATETLTVLDFSHCKLADEGACAVAEFLSAHAQLRSLRLTGNGIGPTGVAGIVFGILRNENTKLASLSLRLNPLGNEGAVHICALLLRSETLKELNISGCNLGPDAGNSLVEVLGHTKLRGLRLDVSNNDLGDEAGIEFNRILYGGQLASLDARMAGFLDESTRYFSRLSHSD